ncbi:multiple sugar transport system permease protein [Microbacteriaceae bacterium SG_E_30_P1]|uniref:Multiple sugar transport system permease protein n=1 Tax=Antiquaquibacter oligotrophicus TaxID=2880260 RepID=A0ABT6KSD6_9MICO|nr:carbohydrate ABC transporter permease [Antiquaquibacter oligotrophicus]MDH6182094.1 multiple sugar transport system permease protein [Antiquaquibacter oligotrophicus]UDF12241.1 carbohydrate ABC transporter permease [Antiquaquibacter oligotrophicus]
MSAITHSSVQSVARTRRRRGKSVVGPTFRTIAIVFVVLLFIAPLAWMLLAAFKTNLDIVTPSRTFDFTPTLGNFETVFGAQNFLPFILNSLIVGFGSTVVALILGVPAAYGIARYTIRNATAFVLLARVIPGVSLLIPWYFLFSQVQLVGTYTVLILTHIFVTMPLVVAIMTGFFEGLPNELEEAAQIDGCGKVEAFIRVVLPLSLPGLATSAILSFIFSWNNFLFALVLSNQSTRTLPVAISNFTSYASVDWGGLMAAAVIITIPVMLVALFAQKYVISGLTAGATKG